MKPLLGERHLSKSAVSRIVARLKARFTTWQTRNLQANDTASCMKGATSGAHGATRRRRPGLAALNSPKRTRTAVALQLAATEAQVAWGGVLTDLQRRGLPPPLLVETDGYAGLKNALETLN